MSPVYDGPTWWVGPDHECSAWMRDAVNRRIALIAATMTIHPRVMILCPLVEPPPTRRGRPTRRALRRWDRCCDRCTHYVPPSQDLICGTTTHQLPTSGALATFTFGLCTGCAHLEGVGRPAPNRQAAS